LNIRKRTNTSSNNLLGAISDWDETLGQSSGATGNFTEGHDYSLIFAFSYDGSSTTISAQITGGNFSGMLFEAIDDSPTTTFNQLTLRFGTGANQFTSINFTEFKIEQTPIPEPSSAVLLAGIAAVGVACGSRRRR
jgi:hypothetical protein